ncbi:MAG TPA: hypothetical protein VN924_28985 [Bryobacteraceae bacterium]|jgi:methyl-accepting chemotaxis protein|nr:hypothetical protein [Bryobacteraceae bacterium]
MKWRKPGKNFRPTRKRIRKTMVEYAAIASLQAQAHLGLGEIRSELDNWQSQYEQINRLCMAGKPNDALVVLVETRAYFAAIDKIAGDLVAHENEVLAKNKQLAADQYNRSRTISFVMLALAIGAAVLWVVRQTSGTLRQLADEMADGAAQLAAAASEVSSSSQSLAQGASEQAASLEETSASSQEIGSKARNNSANSAGAAAW